MTFPAEGDVLLPFREPGRASFFWCELGVRHHPCQFEWGFVLLASAAASQQPPVPHCCSDWVSSGGSEVRGLPMSPTPAGSGCSRPARETVSWFLNSFVLKRDDISWFLYNQACDLAEGDVQHRPSVWWTSCPALRAECWDPSSLLSCWPQLPDSWSWWTEQQQTQPTNKQHVALKSSHQSVQQFRFESKAKLVV